MSDRRDEDEQPPVVIQPEAAEADEAPHDDEDYDGEDDGPDDLDGPYTSRHFHLVTHKLISNAVMETLGEAKLDWNLVAPFLESAREMAQGDFDEGQIRIHTVRAEDDGWVEAEEAYLGISVADRDSGEEWLSETRWLSELAIAEDDPEQVRLIVAALERSIAKMRTWLAEKEAGGAAPTPPAETAAGGSDRRGQIGRSGRRVRIGQPIGGGHHRVLGQRVIGRELVALVDLGCLKRLLRPAHRESLAARPARVPAGERLAHAGLIELDAIVVARAGAARPVAGRRRARQHRRVGRLLRSAHAGQAVIGFGGSAHHRRRRRPVPKAPSRPRESPGGHAPAPRPAWRASRW